MATKKKTEVKEEEVKEVKVATKTAKSSKSETSASVQNQQELSVEDRLKSLYQLQKVMSKIDEIKILRGDLPIEIQDLEDEVLGLHTRLERYTTEIKDNEKKIAAGKNAIEEAKLKLDKKAEQQKQVVNNREYEILSKEIENLELDIQIYEKNINDANYEIENKKSELEALSAHIEEKNEDLRLKKTGIYGGEASDRAFRKWTHPPRRRTRFGKNISNKNFIRSGKWRFFKDTVHSRLAPSRCYRHNGL
mgnify:CR=1 FL=1